MIQKFHGGLTVAVGNGAVAFDHLATVAVEYHDFSECKHTGQRKEKNRNCQTADADWICMDCRHHAKCKDQNERDHDEINALFFMNTERLDAFDIKRFVVCDCIVFDIDREKPFARQIEIVEFGKLYFVLIQLFFDKFIGDLDNFVVGWLVIDLGYNFGGFRVCFF